MKVKYSKELLADLAKRCNSVRQVIMELGLKHTGGTHSHLTRKLREYGIDTSHFLGKAANFGKNHRGGSKKISAKDVLVYDRSGSSRREYAFRLRRALIESGVPERCACGLGTEWNGKPIVLQVDHIDGDFLNNRKENLRFLCPNCHSQTETFGVKNANCQHNWVLDGHHAGASICSKCLQAA